MLSENKKYRTERVAAWLFCLVSWVLLVPILLYYLHIFIQVRRQNIIKKRYSKIVICCNLLSAVYLGISRPLSMLYMAKLINSPIVGDIEHLLFSYCIHLLNYFYLLRYWMLFFDIKWTIYSQKRTWYQYINHINCNNFWIRNRKKLGSTKYMMRFVMIPIIITSAITTFFYIEYHSKEQVYEFVEGMLAPLPLAADFILWRLTPAFFDRIKLRAELKLFLIFACIAFAIWLTFPVILGSYNFNDTRDWKHDGNVTYYWLGYVYILSSSLFVWILALITTYWVLNKSGVVAQKTTAPYRILSKGARIKYHKIIRGKMKKFNNKIQSVNTTSLDVHDYNTVNGGAIVLYNSPTFPILGTPINCPNSMKLTDLLSIEYGFDAFIHHIAQEFCIETILCVVECTQFQVFYGEPHHMVFPQCVPESAIVYNVNYSCHDKIKRLCEKYIISGAELEVNIAYRMRRDLVKLYNKLHKIPVQVCKCFFNDVILEMMDLMEDAFNRFKKTKQYQLLKISDDFLGKRRKLSPNQQTMILQKNINTVRDEQKEVSASNIVNFNEYNQALINEDYNNVS